MSYPPTPPPLPYNRSSMTFGTKVLLLGLQCALLMIGALIIWSMSYARDERNIEVASQIAQEWGGVVNIEGPMARRSLESHRSLIPMSFKCEANVETKSLHRNAYEAEVFNAHIQLSGTFSGDSLAELGDTIYLEISLPVEQLAKLTALNISGETIGWQKTDSGISSMISLDDKPRIVEFSTAFDIHGSHALFINQIGEKSYVAISGEAPNPSFSGSSLPNERELTGRHFSALWERESGYRQPKAADDRGLAGAHFLVGVDRYQKVSRTLKYAFIIIVLTYISVMFSEIMMKRQIPLLNYFLIGAALIIFYVLLLSFSEHLSFGLSYFIASTMTVILISGYMWKMLDSRKVGIVIGLLLSLMYLCCYILMILSNFSLLLGSLILFIALAVMMYASLQIKR